MHLRSEDRRRALGKFACGLLCLAFAPAARANTIITLMLDGNFPADYSFYSYTSTTGQAENNIPIGPYPTYLTGGSFNNTLVYSFCYDFDSPTAVGTQYTGTLQTFSDPSDLEASYLVNELNIVGLNNSPVSTRGPISMAIWEIMNASSTNKVTPFPSDPAAQALIAQAANAVAKGWWTSADAALYPVWVPDNPALQRLAIVTLGQPIVSLPEPGSLALMAAGILALGWMGRRRTATAIRRAAPSPGLLA